MSEQETINWIAVADRLPDDQETVLTNVPACGETVWIGWHDDGVWYQADGGEIAYPVTYWATMPAGVTPRAKEADAK